MSSKRYAQVDKEYCVSCGTCTKACPLQAISVPDGISAVVELARCIGCGPRMSGIGDQGGDC